jgi:hypothetical protein
VRCLDAALVTATLVMLCAGCVVARLVGSDLALEAARNSVGYAGLGLIAASVGGPRAGAIAPAVYVVLLAASSSDRSGLSTLWEWPAQGRSSGTAAAAAMLLCCTGLALTTRRRRPREE